MRTVLPSQTLRSRDSFMRRDIAACQVQLTPYRVITQGSKDKRSVQRQCADVAACQVQLPPYWVIMQGSQDKLKCAKIMCCQEA